MTTHPARVHLTLGDPSGIGPEVLARALLEWTAEVPIIHGHRVVLERALALVEHPRPEVPLAACREPDPALLPGVDAGQEITPWEQPGLAQWAYLESAVAAAAAGELDALVTAPINKHSLSEVGFPFNGHTEFLAHRAGVRPAMMFVGPRLRVILVTTHLPLSQVPAALTPARLERILVLAAQTLSTRLGIREPRIAVAGLNPHAGEQGLLGPEEEAVMKPAMQTAATAVESKGLKARFFGPLPADTVYLDASRGRFDAVVAPYHDQALVAVKLLEFTQTVNVTLGLPYLRCSPGHGTAPDIAWKGQADPSGMRAAMSLAARWQSR